MKHYATKLGTPRVEESTDTIYGVSLISLGNAEGHFDKKGRQEVVDEVTLQQVFKYCVGAKTVKIKANHNGQVEEVIGWCDNFSLQAEKVIADAHFYDTEPLRLKLYAIAKQNPDHIAISLEFTGEDKARGEISLSRCEQVVAASFVSEGAANKSLFSANPPEDEKDNTNKTTTKMEDKDKTADEETALTKLQKQFDEYKKKYGPEDDEPDGDEGKGEPGDEDGDEAKKLKAKKLEVADDPEKQPKGSDPEKTYSKKDLESAISAAANSAVKKFAATIGVTKLSPGGNAGEVVKEKSWDQIVDAEKANHKGDRNLAMAHCLSRLASEPEWRKAYSSSRLVKHS